MNIRENLSDSYLKDIKKFDKFTTAWIIKNMKPQLRNILILSLLYGFMAYSGVLMADFAGSIVDCASAEFRDYNKLIGYAIALVILVVMQFVIQILSNKTVFSVNAKLEISIKSKLFKTMLKRSYSSISSYHTGELLNRLTNDVTVITNTITSIIPKIVYFAVKLIGVFSVLFMIDWKFTIFFLIGGLLVILVMTLFRGVLKNLHKKVQDTDGKTKSFMQEALSALLMIKVFNGYKYIIDEADTLQQKNYDVKNKRNNFSILSTSAFSFVFSVAYVYGLVWGAYSIYTGNITYGILTQVLSLVTQIQSPVRGLTSILPMYYQCLASAERIMQIEDLPGEHIVKKNASIKSEDIYKNLDSIEFDNITFAYDQETILQDTNLSIKKGDFVIISGVSGIGKSTLVKLLLDVFPIDNGEIYLKLTDGRKIQIDKNLRNIFAYVPQGNFLLSGTIKDNIAFIKPEATDEEINLAIKTACAEFIYDLPMGLETKIGEKGYGLSEGQVQRIAIARAIICDKPIILLDEATSALDLSNETKLLQNIKSLKNKTCILISHKETANSVCNKIVKIENKKIILKEKENENCSF